IPILLGIRHLYEWSDPDVVAHDAVLQAKHAYLNVPFFIGRAALYFLAWTVFAQLLNRWSAEQDATGNPRLVRQFQLLSAPGIVVYSLTFTFASVDWATSLDSHCFSTFYVCLFIVIM